MEIPAILVVVRNARRGLFVFFAILVLFAAGTDRAFAAGHEYHVGEVIVYDNPNDDVPARKGRVTKISGDQIWVDFSEFNPGLNVAEASKILFKGTNQVDDFTMPAAQAANGGGAAGRGQVARTAAPPVQQAAATPRAARRATAVQPAAGGLNSLFGRWSTLQIGHTILTAPGDGYIYQKQEIAAKAGDIVIRPNGTFTWNSKSQGVINGKWREATADEVRGGFGGPGIRLIHGESGWDYNVQLRPQTGVQPAASIAIWTQGYQVNAYRVG